MKKDEKRFIKEYLSFLKHPDRYDPEILLADSWNEFDPAGSTTFEIPAHESINNAPVMIDAPIEWLEEKVEIEKRIEKARKEQEIERRHRKLKKIRRIRPGDILYSEKLKEYFFVTSKQSNSILGMEIEEGGQVLRITESVSYNYLIESDYNVVTLIQERVAGVEALAAFVNEINAYRDIFTKPKGEK